MEHNTKLEQAVLELLDESEQPLGSSSIASALVELGFQISEATAGRLLRSMDNRGLTRMPGPKLGRLITSKGQEHLLKLSSRHDVEQRGVDLVHATTTADRAELIDVLIARRAVETESARLAAVNATEEELAGIRMRARHDEQTVEEGRLPGISDSAQFHRAIAEASHNRILLSLAELMIETPNPNLERALRQVAIDTAAVGGLAVDHSHIADALSTRDPELAAAVTHSHLTHLIEAARASIAAGSTL